MKKAGTFKIIENWKFTLKDNSTGKIIEQSERCNTIVNNGLTHLRNWLAGDTVNEPVALAIGTDNTAVTNSDTSLGTEYSRASADVSKDGDYAVEFTHDFTFGSGVSTTIYEAGLFDSAIASGSTMIARTTDSGKSVDSGTTLTVTCTITVSRV
ncbi:MAG: hypothetical protein ACTSWG_13445 [Candidatus Helarchaeota archaeon]